MSQKLIYSPKSSFLRVATACPEVMLADVAANVEHIVRLYHQACRKKVSLVVFPELSVTGYTLGDLVQQNVLLDRAEKALQDLAARTLDQPTAMVIGLPLRAGNDLYDCAAVLADGEIKGVVPKSYLPTYNEFYEHRWYQVWRQPNTVVELDGQAIPFGKDLLFGIAGVWVGVEICEDLWVSHPPSIGLAESGAQVIVNPSASPEQVSKTAQRRDLVRLQSEKLICGYLYAGCDESESTAEIVMSGHQLIAAGGQIYAERAPLSSGQRLLVADIDIDHLSFDRRRRHMLTKLGVQLVATSIKRHQTDFMGPYEPHPFLPLESAAMRKERLQMAVQIQAHGLAQRLRTSGQQRVVLGVSGGLDSALALLVACEAAPLLGRDRADLIHTLTMPGPASSSHTQTNAQALTAALGVPNRLMPINGLVEAELTTLGHDHNLQDITYENVQARARTSLLFNYANQHQGMVLGTGTLSEIALGWCTYNADQQSHYNVNASIPKSLGRHLVAYLAGLPAYKSAQKVLEAILKTPMSPELTTAGKAAISQATEEIIGPYELHDFFLNYLIRWGDSPAKIAWLAEQAFAGQYTDNEIDHWLSVFIRRFAKSQFKRDTLPNGPKVGSVSLSPRGDLRMPSDLKSAALWGVVD
jgi:NAD+ synthase (glutamine-hydrolysing)